MKGDFLMMRKPSEEGMILCLLLVLSFAVGSHGKFTAYWNLPLEGCAKEGVYLDLDKFDIVHNTNNTFYGDKVNIFYSPGSFPTYNSSNVPVNGGIPQLGNLTRHEQVYMDRVNEILSTDYSGPAPLDFETYLPSYDVSLPTIYRDKSVDWVKEQHPTWNKSRVLEEARRTFNESSRPYFESLLTLGSKARPNALFGYYHYPYCHNYNPPYTSCDPTVMKMNDEIKPWLFNESTALYPSVYTFHTNITPEIRWDTLTTKLKEAQRINKGKNLPILPYFWYRYHDDDRQPRYLSDSVACAVLWMVRQFGGDGVMVWGKSADLSDRTSCLTFKNYMESTLGPLLKCFHDMPDSWARSLIARYPTENEGQQDGQGDGPNTTESDFVRRYNQQIIVEMIKYYCMAIVD